MFEWHKAAKLEHIETALAIVVTQLQVIDIPVSSRWAKGSRLDCREGERRQPRGAKWAYGDLRGPQGGQAQTSRGPNGQPGPPKFMTTTGMVIEPNAANGA